MVGVLLNWPILNEKPLLFAGCFVVVLTFSVGLLLLARWRRWAAISASVLALAWILFLEPDLQYYLDVRHATAESIIEPFYRQHYVRGYILVFMPTLFVLLGF